MYRLNPREVTFTLSEALDFVGIDDTLHGKRVAYMAAEVAKQLQWSDASVDLIIYTGMLHDCGVSSSIVHGHLINELDWSHSSEHAMRGYELLRRVSLYQDCALPVRYHHTHWRDLPETLDDFVKLQANLIYLVDRVDAIQATSKTGLAETKQTVFDTLTRLAGDFFSPELVEAFICVAQVDSFWYFLEEQSLRSYLDTWIKKQGDVEFSFATVKEMSLVFAAAVDAKSPFTSEHSIGVANLARHLGHKFSLDEKEQCDLELAGLFHDLGKLKVPDEILNKPAKLDVGERMVMNRHGFDSNIILQHIAGFKRIALLASKHHETLDGQGYPYHLSAEQIDLPARILAVADIFQALVQNRPYRNNLSATDALNIMEDMVSRQKIDGQVVKMLKENLDECYHLALSDYALDNAPTQYLT